MRVHVFGNGCRDLTYRVPALPMPGETVLADRPTSEPGGKGLNQAIAARRIGARTRLLAIIGQDEAGARLRDLMVAEDLPTDGLVDKALRTDTSHIFVDSAGENTVVTVAPCAAAASRADFAEALNQLAAGDIVLLQGNFDGLLSAEIMRCARDRRCRVVLNASPLWKDVQRPLALADVLLVNRQEATALTGVRDPLEALGSLNAPVAIVTAGADGAFLRNGVTAIVQVPAARVAARNTTGAGDVLAGSLAGALALGLAVPQALQVAVTLAADKVTREGVISGFPSAEVARSLIAEHRHAAASR
ncbi:MAG: PfkB family carbohydrate kinase [Pseudomonadota bacterium]|nr:PfkB family carbohydrate kinase [Pseudomonadota bacterium]